ncbi:MAG TPA: hypothetical protein VGF91_12815 [Solirubrobacteraceae bacterium]|jgi:pimeloyl-ACP methyl ester carboxylesterase
MSGVTVMAVVVASCSSSTGSGWSGSAATGGSVNAPAATTSAQPMMLLRPLKPVKQPSARRGAPHVNATLVQFGTADGITRDGTMVGAGTVGVVRAHEYDNDLCGACPFANYPANRGLRLFAVDVRCFARPACPQGDAASRLVDDLAAAVAQLRQRGATRAALVGASMGGSAGLSAAARVKPPVDPVVELSGQATPTNLHRIQFDGFHGWVVLTNARGGLSLTTTKAPSSPQPHTAGAVSESIAACGMMVHRCCGVGPRFEGWRHSADGRCGGVCVPTMLAVVVALVGRGSCDRRDDLPVVRGSASGWRGCRQVCGAS